MNLGLPEMIFIFLLALIIFGPKKLPEIGRQIGKAMNEFKRASNEFKSQIEGEIRNLELEEAAKKPPEPQILPPEKTIFVSSGENPHPVPANPAETRVGQPASATTGQVEELPQPSPPPPRDAQRSGQASPGESVGHPASAGEMNIALEGERAPTTTPQAKAADV